MTTAALAELIKQVLGQMEEETPGSLRPFEPTERIPWALENGVQNALTDQEWATFKAAMPPASEYGDLLAGVVEGVWAAVNDMAKEHLGLAKMALQFTVEFYSVVYDVPLWGLILTYWVNPSSTPQGLATHIQQKHPALWTAIREYPKFEAKVDAFIERITSDEKYANTAWTESQVYVTDLMCDLVFGLGRMLKESANAIAAKKGDAEAQGEIIGRRFGLALIEAILLALGLFALVRGAAKELGKAAMKAGRSFFKAPELAKIASKIDNVTPGLSSVGRTLADDALRQVESAYQRVAGRVAPFKTMSKETGAFNRGVRDVYGYSVADVEYVALRLDAHHIIEERYFARFQNEFRQKLKWNTGDDMDTIALHTEWHIRSGKNMSKNLGRVGADKEVSLTKALDDAIKLRDQQAGGFTNLRQLVDAYEEVYKEYAGSTLHPMLQDWFAGIKARLP